MAEIAQFPVKKTTSNSLSSPEVHEVRTCPYCGREKHKKSFELLGVTITVIPSCDCEIKAHELEMERFKSHHEREAKRRLLSESGLSGNAEDYTFDNFILRSGTEKALQAAKDFVDNFDFYRLTGQGITFIGEYGNGKSHLAAAVVHCLIKRSIPASFQPVPELLQRVRATFDNSGNETETAIMRIMQNVKCLVLDDVGAQKGTEWSQQFLYTVIDYRYRHKLPTIVTSNCSAVNAENSLTDALGGRSIDRLLERNNIIKITATSYRWEIAKRRMVVVE